MQAARDPAIASPTRLSGWDVDAALPEDDVEVPLAAVVDAVESGVDV